MNILIPRRHFLKRTATASVVAGMGELSFLGQLPRVSAAEARLETQMVRLRPEIEPLVKLLEETPRDRLLEEIASRIKRGLSYREVVAALMLAGVRNIQPRPVGHKFHAVLVVNSAHLASLASPDSDRWLPIFWALDYFKSSQAQNAREGDWEMVPANESKLPPAHRAKQAFIEAMEAWDEPAADVAVTALARSAGSHEVFELFARLGARDFRDIGHKAIYVANSWRTLQAIGWQHAEPVLRSLAYALLADDGDKPATQDAPADRPWRRNQPAAAKIRAEWQDGQTSSEATSELLDALRHVSANEASDKVVEMLNRGIGPQSVWDALLAGAGEMLMCRPGIVSLHAVTSTNALHFAFQNSGDDLTRRLLLLQNAAFLPLFRGDTPLKAVHLDELAPPESGKGAPPAEDQIFAAIGHDRLSAARHVLAYLKENSPQPFIASARRLIFLKGNNAHDYKFSSAVLEDYQNVSPAWRDRFLAASVFNLRGSGEKDNELVKRTRAALA